MIRILFSAVIIFAAGSLSAIEIGKSPRFSIRYKTALVEKVAFSADSRLIAVTDWKKVRLFNAENGEPLKILGEFPEKVMNVRFSRSGKYLASDSYGGTGPSQVIIWDVQSGRKLREIGGIELCGSMAFSPDEKTLALACMFAADNKDFSMTLWDVASGKRLAVLDRRPVAEYSPESIVFSKDGRFLINAVQNRGHGVQIWNLTAMKLEHFIATPLDVTSVALDPAEKILMAALYIPESATQRPEGILTAFDFSTRAKLFELRGIKGHVTALSFHPSGRYLASSEFGSRPSFSVWDIQEKKARYRHEEGPRPTLDIAFSPDGKSLAVAVNTYGDIGNPSTLEMFDAGSAADLRNTGALNDLSTFKSGERVRVKIEGRWYTGSVSKTGNGQYLVQMDNSQPEYWKWVKPIDLRPLDSTPPRNDQPPRREEQPGKPEPAVQGSYATGEKVQILWNNKWYPGEILEVRAGSAGPEYLVKYQNYDASWNEWIKPDRLKK